MSDCAHGIATATRACYRCASEKRHADPEQVIVDGIVRWLDLRIAANESIGAHDACDHLREMREDIIARAWKPENWHQDWCPPTLELDSGAIADQKESDR